MLELLKKAGSFIENQFDSTSEESTNSMFNQMMKPSLPVSVPSVLDIEGKKIRISKFIDEGGFSYVFKARDEGSNVDKYALKRLLIQSSEQMKIVEKELNIMKEINGHNNIIRLIGSIKRTEGNNNNVVYLLMELGECTVLDLMNERMKNGQMFSEKTVLRIFLDCALGLAHLHCKVPAIQHRDIKVENLLKIDNSFKLCDFGSCTRKTYDLKKKHERSEAEDDIGKNTTLEYRSPEMVDLYSGFEINIMSDIWALGCLLYKLMYFKGCFDDASSLQIIVGKYVIPKSPKYSTSVLNLLRGMLNTDPSKRLDVYEVVEKVCEILKIENPLGKKPKGIIEAKNGKLKRSNDDNKSKGGIVTRKVKKTRRNKKNKKNKKKIKKPVVKLKEDDNDDDWDENFDATFEKFEKKNEKLGSQKKSTPSSDGDESDDDDDNDELFSQLDWQENDNDNDTKDEVEKKKKKKKIKKKKKNSKVTSSGIKPPSPRPSAQKKVEEKNDDSNFDWGNDEGLFSGMKIMKKNPPKTVTEKKVEKKIFSKSESELESLIMSPKEDDESIDPKKKKKKNDIFDQEDLLEYTEGNQKHHRKSRSKFTVPQQNLPRHMMQSMSSIPKVNSFDNFQIPRFYVNGYMNQPRANYKPTHSRNFYSSNIVRNPVYGHQDKGGKKKSSEDYDFLNPKKVEKKVEVKKKKKKKDEFGMFMAQTEKKKVEKKEEKKANISVEDFFSF